MGGGTGGGGGALSQTFQRLTLQMLMHGAWKESTSNGPRPLPPQSSQRGAALGQNLPPGPWLSQSERPESSITVICLIS